MTERLLLVARFEDLRVADTVILKACRACGDDHRGTLGKLKQNATCVVWDVNADLKPLDATEISLDVFTFEPRVHVIEERAGGVGISRIQVDDHRVFLVIPAPG